MTVDKRKGNCRRCNKEVNTDDIRRQYGSCSHVYMLSYCSVQCYTKNFTEPRFYASEVEDGLLDYTAQIYDRENDDASKGVTMITLTYSDREELEERVEQILQTLNK